MYRFPSGLLVTWDELMDALTSKVLKQRAGYRPCVPVNAIEIIGQLTRKGALKKVDTDGV